MSFGLESSWTRLPSRRSHSDYAGHISVPPRLCALSSAFYYVAELYSLWHRIRRLPLGVLNLCPENESISTPKSCIYMHMSRRLNGISVEQNIFFFADGRQLFYRLEGSDFIVNHHYGDKGRIFLRAALKSSTVTTPFSCTSSRVIRIRAFRAHRGCGARHGARTLWK